MNFLRLQRTWWLTLLGGYVVSMFWLGSYALAVPAVVWWAPLGIMSLLAHASPANHPIQIGPTGVGLHVFFWVVFCGGVLGRTKLSKSLLCCLYFIVVLVLLLTVEGCSRNYPLPHGYDLT